MFTITHYDEKYFATPTNDYLNKYPDILNKVCPKYSFGAKNALAICELSIYDNTICLKRFNNYFLRYCCDNDVLYDDVHKGLGLRLLKSVIIKLLNEQKINNEYRFFVWLSDDNNKNLIKYYNSMSFIHNKKNQMETTIYNFVKTTENIVIF